MLLFWLITNPSRTSFYWSIAVGIILTFTHGNGLFGLIIAGAVLFLMKRKKELKIKALQAAKAKAIYMVEALGEKLGGVIDIQEINNEAYPQPMYRANVMMMKSDSMGAEAAAPELDFKKIKLNYVVNTIFEIK